MAPKRILIIQTASPANDPKRDFRREDGQDDVLAALAKARDSFRDAMATESAFLAESLDPEFRRVGRKILGIEDSRFDEAQERRIATIIKVIEGDPKAMFALACNMVEGGEAEGEMKAFAATLLTLHAIIALRAHAGDPQGGDEGELMKSLELLPPPIGPMIYEELYAISRRSRFEDVRSAAKAMLDQMGAETN